MKKIKEKIMVSKKVPYEAEMIKLIFQFKSKFLNLLYSMLDCTYLKKILNLAFILNTILNRR